MPIAHVNGRIWYTAFKNAIGEFFSWEGIAKKGLITQIWKKAMKDFHEAINYETKMESSNIDLTVFDKKHTEAQIAIELQHDKNAAMERDVPKLACSNAKLKVLLTRIFTGEDIENYKKTIIDFWKKRSKRVQNDELLLLLTVRARVHQRFFTPNNNIINNKRKLSVVI